MNTLRERLRCRYCTYNQEIRFPEYTFVSAYKNSRSIAIVLRNQGKLEDVVDS